jgi:hypothetical protein
LDPLQDFDGNVTGQYLANRKLCSLELRLSISWRSVCDLIIAAVVCLNAPSSVKRAQALGHIVGVYVSAGVFHASALTDFFFAELEMASMIRQL